MCGVLFQINVECIAIINDPVGALISQAHSDKNCMVGLILGNTVVYLVVWSQCNNQLKCRLEPIYLENITLPRTQPRLLYTILLGKQYHSPNTFEKWTGVLDLWAIFRVPTAPRNVEIMEK